MTGVLSDEAVETAADALLQARLQTRVIDGLPPHARPTNLDDAYRIQDRLVAKFGKELGGWFSGGTNPDIQQRLGLDGPYWARLFEHAIKPSPARVRAVDYPPIVLECEFVFVLARDVPVRDRPYTREEVEGFVGSVHPAIELVAGFLKDWMDQDIYSLISDNGTDGALFYGPACAKKDLDFADVEVTLTVNGDVVETGHGRNALGHPLDALMWLVNARIARGEGLKRGHYFSTGSTTPMHPVAAGDVAMADFGPLGRVELRID